MRDVTAPTLPEVLVGPSPGISALRVRLARAAAAAELPVVLSGRPSAGKRLCARMLHGLSPRVDAPCVTLGCSELRQSEAAASVEARLNEARLGSLVLHDAQALPEAGQDALMRHLLRRENPASFPNVPDTRLVACSTVDLLASSRIGRFREDLARRLLVLSVPVLDLAERRADIPALASLVLETACVDGSGTAPRLSQGALRKLEAHGWPGNARELRAVLERAVLLSGDNPVIEAEDIILDPIAPVASSWTLLPSQGINLPRLLNDVERSFVREALERTAWNRQRAARLLGLQRTTLVQKLRRWERDS